MNMDTLCIVKLDLIGSTSCGTSREDYMHDRAEHVAHGGLSGCLYHEFDDGSRRDTIDITPSDEGYVAIAKVFIDSVLRDVPARRTDAVRDQLGQVLTIVGYFAQTGKPELGKQVIEYMEGNND